MKIEDVKKAIDIFITSSEKYINTAETGNYRLGNKLQDKITECARYLEKNKSLSELMPLFDHINMQVRLSAAYYLLTVNEEKSISVLKEIIAMNIPHTSFEAKYTLSEWEEGNLKIYFGE